MKTYFITDMTTSEILTWVEAKTERGAKLVFRAKYRFACQYPYITVREVGPND